MVTLLDDLTDARRTIESWLVTRRLHRRFREAQKFRLDAMPEDTVGKVRGHAGALGDTLIAPISPRPCVYWPDPDTPPDAGYRGAGPTRMRLTSSARHPLAITDDPRLV